MSKSLNKIFSSNSNKPYKTTIQTHLEQGLEHLKNVRSSGGDNALNQYSLAKFEANYLSLVEKTPQLAIQLLKKQFPKPKQSEQTRKLSFQDLSSDSDNSQIGTAVLQMYGPDVHNLFVPFFEGRMSNNPGQEESETRARIVNHLRLVYH